jgi:hypothetical protein
MPLGEDSYSYRFENCCCEDIQAAALEDLADMVLEAAPAVADMARIEGNDWDMDPYLVSHTAKESSEESSTVVLDKVDKRE